MRQWKDNMTKDRQQEYISELEGMLQELEEECRGCPHEDDFGKEVCMDCGIRSQMFDIKIELSEMEEINESDD